MKIFLIADTHFGAYPVRADVWTTMMRNWAYDFLIPNLIKYAKPGDILVHLGDVYDNRTSINVKSLNTAVEIFKDIGEILPVHVLVGNHDMWAMSNRDIISTASIKYVPNVTLYTEPTIVNFNGTSTLMCPWVTGKDAEKDVLNSFSGKAKLLFTHSDLQGCRTQVSPTRPINRNVCGIDDFDKFEKVYSGHIHIRQTIGNFTFVGSPYHLDRNDIGNKKGLYVLDSSTLKDKFIPNDISPEFIPIIINTQADLDAIDHNIVKSNYVDLKINNDLIISNPSARLTIDRLLAQLDFQSISYFDVRPKEAELVESISTEYERANFSLDIKSESVNWIKNKTYSEDITIDSNIKNGLIDIIDEAFNVYEKQNKDQGH